MWSRFILLVFLIMTIGLSVPGTGAEKFKLGTATKDEPHYYLLFTAAEQQKFWQANGLDGEWVPLRGAAPVYQALASGSVQIGMSSTLGGFQAASRGLPVLMIYDLLTGWPNAVYVLAASRIKEPRDLKGARIGIVRFGGMNYAYGLQVARVLGLEKDVRWVATGGAEAAIAALKAGAVDALVRTVAGMITLKVAGQVREVLTVEDYLPKEWTEIAAFAHRDDIKSNADNLKKAVRVLNQATNFVKENRDWAMKEMKAGLGYSDEVARIMYGYLNFVKGGKVQKKAVENVRNFLIDYQIVPREKTPPAEELFTVDFTG